MTPTRLRPDMIILELSVPWEECIDKTPEKKCAKHQEMVEECRQHCWKMICELLGFCRVFTQLGIVREAKRTTIRDATEAAEKTTRWLWVLRGDPSANALEHRPGIDHPG